MSTVRGASCGQVEGKLQWKSCEVSTLNFLRAMNLEASSGIGWAGGWGRISGMVMAPFAGAMALRMMLPLDAIMGIVAALAVAVGIGVIVLGFVAPVLHPRKGAAVPH